MIRSLSPKPTAEHRSRSLVIKDSGISVSLVTSDRTFNGLGSVWNDIASEHPEPSAFFSFEWFNAAWQWRKDHAELALIVVKRGPSVLAIGPVVKSSRKAFGLRIRSFEFLSIPDTQECDFLCRSGEEAAVARAVCRWLSMSRSWDTFQFRLLPPNSFVESYLMPAASEAGIWLERRRGETNLALPLNASWADYYGRRSRRLKKGLNLIANRLAKQYPEIKVVGQVVANVSSQEREGLKQDLVAVSENSWKHESTDTSFATAGPQAFLNSLMSPSEFLQHIYVWRLFLDSQCVATELQLVHSGVISALRSDFDRAFERASPGTHLYKELLQALFDQGLQQYRMGPGANAYKLRWSEHEIDLPEIRGYAKTARGRILRVYESAIRPALSVIYAKASELGRRLTGRRKR